MLRTENFPCDMRRDKVNKADNSCESDSRSRKHGRKHEQYRLGGRGVHAYRHRLFIAESQQVELL